MKKAIKTVICSGCETPVEKIFYCPICMSEGCEDCTDQCVTEHVKNKEMETYGD